MPCLNGDAWHSGASSSAEVQIMRVIRIPLRSSDALLDHRHISTYSSGCQACLAGCGARKRPAVSPLHNFFECSLRRDLHPLRQEGYRRRSEGRKVPRGGKRIGCHGRLCDVGEVGVLITEVRQDSLRSQSVMFLVLLPTTDHARRLRRVTAENGPLTRPSARPPARAGCPAEAGVAPRPRTGRRRRAHVTVMAVAVQPLRQLVRLPDPTGGVVKTRREHRERPDDGVTGPARGRRQQARGDLPCLVDIEGGRIEFGKEPRHELVDHLRR